MPQFGSNPSVSAQNLSATQDPNGNPIISSENNFGASPLGVAARTQALYGIPNAHFDLTCPDPDSEVEVNNAIPYWDLEYSGAIATTMVYDATTQNWSVRMDPTGAEADDYAILKARTYLLNDTDLALRQKAFASLTKVGTAGTAEWSIVLSATYYDTSGTELSTFDIGTAADTGTWTGISGVTTSGSAAISTSAAYADIALTLTAAGSVSGTAKVDINSVLMATSQTGGGSSSFLITETFLSSGTFTRPAGVDFVTVVGMSGGEAGQSGALTVGSASTSAVFGGGGGDSGRWFMMRDIALGTATSVSVGVGAGGSGGTALTFTKAATGTATSTQSGDKADGGATTFGSFFSIPGGGVGGGGVTQLFYNVGGGSADAVNGGNGAVAGTAKNGLDGTLSAYTLGAPFTTFVSGGVAGAAASGSGGSSGTASSGGVAGTVAGIGGGGGGGGNGTAASSPSISAGGIGGAAGAGSGGGGAVRRIGALSQTIVVTGGAGASAVANTGAGGGGGGCVGVAASSSANYISAAITANSGAGGDGASGFVTVVYVG